MECTKCHRTKELAKGKRWCKDCKNAYERDRVSKQTEEKQEELRNNERKRYHEKKKQIEEVIVDNSQTKICTVCNENKTLDNFHVAKCKGNIRSMCKSCSSLKRKEYYRKNKDKVNKQVTKYQVEKMKKDPIFKLKVRLRTRVYQALKNQGKQKNKRTLQYIDCTPQFFQEWIQFQLYDGMTLENYGKYWHVDHVIPCSKFDLSKPEKVNQCFNWKNLRPYLASKNLAKNDTINHFDTVLQELKVNYFVGIKNKRSEKHSTPNNRLCLGENS